MPIYDKPTKELMREFADDQLKKGQIFEKKLAVDWFKRHYPKLKSSTVQMHVEAMAINAALRRHHPNVREGSGHDFFIKVAPGRFRLWDAAIDPAPAYGDFAGHADKEASADTGDEESGEAADQAYSSEFAFERDLRNYLAKNLNSLEPGLTLYADEGFTGVEFAAGGRYIDILAVDVSGGYVVIELKVSRGYDRVIGQLMRYMAWVRENLADNKPVRGMIVAGRITDDLKLAASLLSGIKLVEYEISFKLRSVSA